MLLLIVIGTSGGLGFLLLAVIDVINILCHSVSPILVDLLNVRDNRLRVG
jgi:hypothetical protein